MNLRAIFDYRSGRVIAALRVTLAFVFLVALAFEPVTGGESIRSGSILISSYLLLGLGLVVVAWRSWWLDQRLALPILVIDIAVFLGAVYITEGYDADFTSPFLALFTLSVLSSSLRWDWVMAARTGVIVTILFIVLGLILPQLGYPLDIGRFSRRSFYMVALLLVLVWFGIDRRGIQVPPLFPAEGAGDPAALGEAALRYALAVTGASHGALAWSDSEEPWIDIHEIRPDGTAVQSRIGPADLPAWEHLGPEPQLFDLVHRVALQRDPRGRTLALRLNQPIPLAVRAGIDEGLAVPLACSTREGLLVLGGIDGPGPDFLALGIAIARVIETTADRLTAARLERETAVVHARGAIARDLHDSVAQSLAGACFRLEALRRSLADGTAASPVEEIGAVRDALRAEQAQVRGLIDALRRPVALELPRPLATDLERTLTDAAAHWNVSTSFAAESAVEADGSLSHELRQLLREAVANAARHGRASAVEVRLAAAGGRLDLVIADNGTGFRNAAGPAAPWSISERVAALGGRIEVDSSASGTRLAISLPLVTSSSQSQSGAGRADRPELPQ